MPGSPPPGMTPSPRRGHTLWEMVVVLLLLGAIAALVAPAVGTLRPSRDDEVSRTTEVLLQLLAQARRTALERGQTIDVVVDPAGARAWIIARDNDAVRLAGAVSLAVDARAVVAAGTPRARFTFTPTGLATGGPITIVGARESREIAVDAWSGEIHAAAR